ncbi:hypothetical protein CDAR_114041 [Caerostris darwini]|uniref:Uncharacterized protein n=1 Tax=Caerostris darwini TaxID=1538125 RepID=A0AAV4RXI2_9ARAC|nr:hypothetical protein CDAR_114041 [Caerostris darwini]
MISRHASNSAKREKVFTKLVFIAQINRCYGRTCGSSGSSGAIRKRLSTSRKEISSEDCSSDSFHPISAGEETIFYRVWIPFPLVNAPEKKYGAMHFAGYWGSTIWDIFQKQQMCYIMCKYFLAAVS